MLIKISSEATAKNEITLKFQTLVLFAIPLSIIISSNDVQHGVSKETSCNVLKIMNHHRNIMAILEFTFMLIHIHSHISTAHNSRNWLKALKNPCETNKSRLNQKRPWMQCKLYSLIM